MTTKSLHPETIALHGGSYRRDESTNSVAVPIYQTTSYQFNSQEHASNLFSLKELREYLYPNNESLLRQFLKKELRN